MSKGAGIAMLVSGIGIAIFFFIFIMPFTFFMDFIVAQMTIIFFMILIVALIIAGISNLVKDAQMNSSPPIRNVENTNEADKGRNEN